MNDRASTSILQRTVRNLRSAWHEIAGPAREDTLGTLAPDLPDRDRERVRLHMQACLEGRGGEVSARARAAILGRAYLALDATGRRRFLQTLATGFDADDARIAAAAASFTAADDDARRAARQGLRRALDPPRRRLLTQFNALPEGVKFLVDLRAELLPLAREDAALADLEADLRDLLAAWFDVGFLELRRITWNSPASLLEKLIAYEAVHEIAGWGDLKNRLDSDRRCFAFFHPRMPEEPLIFVEIALTRGIADNIQALLDPAAPAIEAQTADTAIFYSISNTQRGLDGIAFGGFLIKRVVDELQQAHERLANFATLSPIPGFRRWLDQTLARDAAYQLTAAERKALAEAAPDADPDRRLAALLADPAWTTRHAPAIRGPLVRLCARYLVEEKREDGRVRDPVGHFHLSNGARVERINWLADISARGLAQSAGLMVNYQYRPDEIADNHEAYFGNGAVPASTAVRRLIQR